MTMPETASDLNYQARVYRDKVLTTEIERQVEILIRSLLNNEKDTLVIRCLKTPRENPHGEYHKKHNWAVNVREWFATGNTKGEALCNFLGVIINGCWFPKT